MNIRIGWLCVITAMGGTIVLAPSRADEKAAELMQRSHNGRAVWSNFPGFSAEVRVTRDGVSNSGTLAVEPDGALSLKLQGSEKGDWAERTLRSVVSHRLSDGDAITDVEFADVEAEHPLGRLIRSRTPAEKSLWRVQGDVLTEVHRVGEGSRFIIRVAEVSRNAEGKHLPRSYTVTTWSEPGGVLQSTRQIFNTWTRSGKFDLPERLLAATSRSDGTRHVEEIVLSNHRLGSNKSTVSSLERSK